jgi:uncharacterized membrane protein
VGRLVRILARLAVVAAVGAWLAERTLRHRAGGAEPAPIRTSVDVEAPIDEVWALLSDIERQPEWMHDLKSVRLLTPPPVGVGTRAVGRVQAFGLAIDDPVEITAFEPPVLFAIRHIGRVAGHGEIRLRPGVDGVTTTVAWDETLIAPLFPHLGRLVLGLVFGSIFERDLERLAARVEAP